MLQQIDWNKVKIHCSSLGVLFIEPKDAAAKKAGELSQTAKSHLIKIYIREYWGRSKDLCTKHMEKGLLVEEDALTILSLIDKRYYKKNTERKSNGFITGETDIVDDEVVIDTKASWDAETFLPKLIESLDKMYIIQLQGYMWLWDKPKAKLSYCLVNTPDSLIQNEKRKLLYAMNVISDEDKEYKLACAEMEKNMIFDDIPIEERVISHIVERDENIIAQIPDKVTKAREFLKYFHDLHLNRKSFLKKEILESIR